MALSKTTRNHDEIREWAEARGAKPAEVASTDTGDGAGILRLEFPKAPNKNDGNLREISWEEFFEKFDSSDLELVLQDVTAEGEQSNFNRFIHPENEEHSSGSARTSPARKGSAGKAPARKAAATKAAGTKKAGTKAPAKKAPAKKVAARAASGATATKKAPTKASSKKASVKKAPARKVAQGKKSAK